MRFAATPVSEIISRLRGFSPVGFLYYISLKLRKKEVVVTGACNGCGACCRSLCLDDGRGWLRSEKAFDTFLRENKDLDCFEIIGRDANGFLLFRCSRLSHEGKCLRYEDRFSFCRSFPDKNLLFCGGKLPEGCGYRFVSVKPFSKFLEKEIELSNEKSPDT